METKETFAAKLRDMFPCVKWMGPYQPEDYYIPDAWVMTYRVRTGKAGPDLLADGRVQWTIRVPYRARIASDYARPDCPVATDITVVADTVEELVAEMRRRGWLDDPCAG